ATNSNAADPFAVFPDGFDGGEVAAVEDVLGGGAEFAFFQIVEGVAGVDGHVLQDARVAVAINHATGAAVADEFRLVELVDVAHRFFPEVAAVEVQIPIEVKIFVAAEAAELFPFAPQMALHFVQGFSRVHDRIAAAMLHVFDFVEQLDEFGFRVIHQAAVAEAEITAGERGERVAEGAAFEAERFEERGQFIVIINEPAGGDAGGGLDAGGMEKFVGALDFFADVGQAAIFLVLDDVMRIDRHDDAGEAVAGEAPHVVFVPQAAVGADHWMDAALGCVARHGAQLLVDHWLAADEEKIADVIFDGNFDDVLGFLQGDAAAGFRVEFGAGKTAEVAIGVADVGDGKLQVTGAAVVEHFADQFEKALFWPNDGLEKVRAGGGWTRRGCGGSFGRN